VKQAFVGHLLQALGYVVEVLPGAVAHPGNHVLVVVHDVEEEGDRYLVEAGCGFPSFEAVRIDDLGHGGFEQIFQDSFLEFRYVKNPGESLIRREHRTGDPPHRPLVPDSLGRAAEVDGWRRFFDFFYPASGNGVSEELLQGIRDVCTLPEVSPFLTSLQCDGSTAE